MPWNYSLGPVGWGYGPGFWEPSSYEYILEEDDPLAPRKRVIVQKRGLLGTGDIIDASVLAVALGIAAVSFWVLTRR